jgi:hypothetical protein
MIIGDPCAFPQFSFHHDLSLADSRPEEDLIPFTSEAGEILSIILEQLADFPGPQKGALLLSGDLGVDKLQLLHYLERVLANPEHPSWTQLLQCLNLSDEARPKVPVRSLFVQLPLDSSDDLSAFFMDNFQEIASDDFPLFPPNGIATEDFSVFLQQISARMVEQSLGVIVLENISERIEQLKDTEKLQDELRLYGILSEAFSQNGILTILMGKERHLDPQDQAAALLTDPAEFDRNYSWIETANPAAFALPQDVAEQKEEFLEDLQLRIYDWIRAEIPSWQPKSGPRYRRDSQALPAAIPENEKAPAGLVYFKSVFDPCWTDEDLIRLQESVYAWILMILNPCERFYEFEARLKQIGCRLPMLLIWRPDIPSKTELENLRSLMRGTVERTDGEELLANSAMEKIRAILAGLYIRRGWIIGSSGQHAICDSIKSQSISQHLSVCLNRLPLQKTESIVQDAFLPAKAAQDRQVMHWAALITGDMRLRTGNVADAEERLNEWWIKSVVGLSAKLPDFPEVFRTTRFWNEIKHVEGPLSALRNVFQSLRSRTLSVSEAMDIVGRNFGWDPERLQKWKQRLEGLEGLLLWLSAFMHAREYLCAAFPLDRENPDRLRESLLQSMEDPSRFLEVEARSEFERRFLEFRKSYTDIYYLLHEDTLHAMRGPKKDEVKIDPVLLRNLDLLSGLQYTDKSYLNRVKLMAKWMQRNQCNLPLRQILEHYPRCYCNFNPSGIRQPAGSYAQISSTIQEGIEYFRTVLRRCGYLIMAELKTREMDDSTLKQITAALSDGPMIPLKPQCINILNGIIVKHPSQFLAEIRKGSKYGRQRV